MGQGLARRQTYVSCVILATLAITTFAHRDALQAVDGQQPPQVPSFKTATAVVPVDVRVTTANGSPVTDLKQSDFVVREDGVPQTIKHFIPISLVGEASQVAERPADTAPPTGFVTPSRRVFLIALGRGRLTGPSNELDALSRFLRERLLPTDRVALFAYNRATAFTTDHAKLVQVLERYRAAHEDIEAEISNWFSGLRAMFVSGTIPEFIQARIDAIFSGVSGLPSRDMRPGQPKGASSATLARVMDTPPTIDEGDPVGKAAATDTWTNVGALDKYMEKAFQSTHDIGTLLKGIDYMRSIEGEKHLVFVTPSRLMLPGLERDRSLATAASDSRVAVDFIAGNGEPEGGLQTTTKFEQLSVTTGGG